MLLREAVAARAKADMLDRPHYRERRRTGPQVRCDRRYRRTVRRTREDREVPNAPFAFPLFLSSYAPAFMIREPPLRANLDDRDQQQALQQLGEIFTMSLSPP